MKRAILLATSAGLLGCGAHMVSSAKPSTSPYAPTNETSRTGIVKYRNDGISAVRRKRRDDAYKQMHESCGGPYHIVSEGEVLDGGHVVQASATESRSENSHYLYIEYRCGES